MKKTLLLLASAVLLLASCAKERIGGPAANGGTVRLTVNAGLMNVVQTKASWDGDGAGAHVNHWIMEVYDAQGKLFDRQEKNDQSGLTNSFDLILIKNQSYKFAFWADTEGSYDADTLLQVKPVSNVAGLDSLDAFFAKREYTANEAGSLDVKLYRPFAQINIVSKDLDTLWRQLKKAGAIEIGVDSTEYKKFKPTDLKLRCKAYHQFNVLDGTASDFADTVFTLATCYADFLAHAEKTTFFMNYLFAASEQELRDIKFSFESNDEAIVYNLTNIPLQRNYRTNVSGNLLSNDATVNVEIKPDWEDPEYDESYPAEEEPVTE